MIKKKQNFISRVLHGFFYCDSILNDDIITVCFFVASPILRIRRYVFDYIEISREHCNTSYRIIIYRVILINTPFLLHRVIFWYTCSYKYSYAARERIVKLYKSLKNTFRNSATIDAFHGTSRNVKLDDKTILVRKKEKNKK